jgi:hypothetical protein
MKIDRIRAALDIPAPLASVDPRLRIPAAGTRDILSLLFSGSVDTATVEAAATEVMDEWLDPDGTPALASPNPVVAMVAQIHRPPDADLLLTNALNHSVEDLSTLPDALLAEPLRFPASYTPPVSLMAWIEGWVRPLQNSSAPYKLTDDLKLDVGFLARGLAIVREHAPDAWILLLRFRLGDLLRAGHPFPQMDKEESQRLIHQYALLLIVIGIRLKAALLRRWNHQPMTQAFRSETEWKYQARSMMSAVVEPARDLKTLTSLRLPNPAGDNGGAFAGAITGTWINHPGLVAMAERLASKLLAGNIGRRSYDDIAGQLQAGLIKHQSGLPQGNISQVREIGWGQQEFVEGRLGCSASRCVVILAASLLEAPARIRSAMQSVVSGGVLFAKPLDLTSNRIWIPSLRGLKRTTQYLRRIADTDRAARSRNGDDTDSNSGFALVGKSLKEFAATYPACAVQALDCNPTVFFG